MQEKEGLLVSCIRAWGSGYPSSEMSSDRVTMKSLELELSLYWIVILIMFSRFDAEKRIVRRGLADSDLPPC